MGSITFQHQDGDLTFPIKEATFAITDAGRLTLSVQCERVQEHSWMASPCFCLVGYPLDSPLVAGLVIRFAGHDDEHDDESEGPRAHVYVGFHDQPRDIEVGFIRVDEDECDIELSWAQADVNYYDDRAKPNRVVGRCTARRGPIENMWIPS
jgi:hypothetical protein